MYIQCAEAYVLLLSIIVYCELCKLFLNASLDSGRLSLSGFDLSSELKNLKFIKNVQTNPFHFPVQSPLS